MNEIRMLRWNCGVTKIYTQKRTCERISKCNTSDTEDHRENTKVVRTKNMNERRPRAKGVIQVLLVTPWRVGGCLFSRKKSFTKV